VQGRVRISIRLLYLIWFFKAQSLPNCKEDLIMNLAISFSSLPYIAIYPGEAQLYPPYPE
jgi:hypothetical protein